MSADITIIYTADLQSSMAEHNSKSTNQGKELAVAVAAARDINHDKITKGRKSIRDKILKAGTI